MTWCSVDKATPRFDLASSAIRCRFVYRLVRLKVLSCVPSAVLSTRRPPSLDWVPMSSVPQRHQHYEGATTSTRRISHNKGFGIAHIGATTGLQHLLSTLQGRCCHRHMQDSLPAGWLAFTGWELNPLVRNERFRAATSLPPFLDLS